MRIAINWSFSTGKTTLANSIPFNKKILSTERILAEEIHFDFNNHSEEELRNFQEKLFIKQFELENKAWEFITDTSLFLIKVYWLEIPEKINKLLSNRYDLVIHLEPEFEIENDEVRHIDYNYQKEIDKKLKNIYNELWIDYKILKGTNTDRLLQFNKIK